MAETQTPIEVIESLIFIADPITGDGRKIVDDARAALEDVEVLLSTLAIIVEKEELPESWDSNSWIDDNNYDDVHGHGMDAGAWYVAKQIRDALAKFPVKS